MKTILNKTGLPVKVPLPRGKAIRLGPHKTGAIADKASDHPPLVELIEAGKIEIVSDGTSPADPRKGSANAVAIPGQGHHAAATVRRTGDR